MKKLMFVLPGALCLSLLVAAAASAGGIKEATSPQKFLLKVANCDYAEIQLGELAKKNAASDDVKKFGQMMIDDHDKCRKDLLNQFKDLKIGVASSMEKEDKVLYDTLSKLKGTDFDREYMKSQVDRHETAMKYLQDSIKSDDGNVREFAQKQLKGIQEHQKRAQEILKNLK